MRQLFIRVQTEGFDSVASEFVFEQPSVQQRQVKGLPRCEVDEGPEPRHANGVEEAVDAGQREQIKPHSSTLCGCSIHRA